MEKKQKLIYNQAPIKIRFLANLFDYFLVFLIGALFWAIIYFITFNPFLASYISGAFFFVLVNLYFCGLDYFFHQTIGKKLLNITIIKNNEGENNPKKISFLQILKLDFLFSIYFSINLVCSSLIYLYLFQHDKPQTSDTKILLLCYQIFMTLFSFSLILWGFIALTIAFNKNKSGIHEIFSNLKIVVVSKVDLKKEENKSEENYPIEKFPDFNFYDKTITKDLKENKK
ncbi:RDD family protein [Mycoplasma sp. SG1]|uniref:RDD family protein n=1 Tax=Mycoplasma sp. SG1 TaxID=2810348 RepID=UPI0020244224|nr:RDD family protein [Mycoplasma sp. SG1]URM52930.1 RDD family protein [Mycoplasma sp. SG1]